MAAVDTEPVARALAAALDGGEVGLQVAVFQGPTLLLELCAGTTGPESGEPVVPRTLFPVFSATKGVAATAVHLQVSRGHLAYDTPIAEVWPEFAAHGKDSATVMDALTHRVGIPQMPAGTSVETMCDWDAMVTAVADLEPVWEPGTRTGYHAYTIGWITGEIVSRTDPDRRPFGRFVQEEICRPLGISDLWLGIPEGVDSRIATLIDLPAAPPAEGLLALAIPAHLATGQAVFGRADVRRACHPGAGGIMNARSLARLYSMLAAGGEALLPPEVVGSVGRLETDDQVDEVLGKVVRKARGYYAYHPDGPDVAALMPSHSPGSFGHPGSGGSTGWADPSLGIGVAVLKNRMLPSALAQSRHLLAVRDAIYEALGA